MAWNVSGSGKFSKDNVSGVSHTGFGRTFFFSGELTTTDDFAANTMDFGFLSGEIIIVNLSSNPLAYQVDLQFGTNKATGVVPANSHITLRNVRHMGLRVKSLNAGASATCGVTAV